MEEECNVRVSILIIFALNRAEVETRFCETGLEWSTGGLPARKPEILKARSPTGFSNRASGTPYFQSFTTKVEESLGKMATMCQMGSRHLLETLSKAIITNKLLQQIVYNLTSD